jgi:hypothetical protein
LIEKRQRHVPFTGRSERRGSVRPLRVLFYGRGLWPTFSKRDWPRRICLCKQLSAPGCEMFDSSILKSRTRPAPRFHVKRHEDSEFSFLGLPASAGSGSRNKSRANWPSRRESRPVARCRVAFSRYARMGAGGRGALAIACEVSSCGGGERRALLEPCQPRHCIRPLTWCDLDVAACFVVRFRELVRESFISFHSYFILSCSFQSRPLPGGRVFNSKRGFLLMREQARAFGIDAL